MNATIIVKHAQRGLRFFADSLDKYADQPDGWAVAYALNMSASYLTPEEMAEKIFSLTNAPAEPGYVQWQDIVTFPSNPPEDARRSLSVGDVVIIEVGNRSYTLGVDSVGFRTLEVL